VPTPWRTASSARRRKTSKRRAPSMKAEAEALFETCHCLSPRCPAATGFWSPFRASDGAFDPGRLSASASPARKQRCPAWRMVPSAGTDAPSADSSAWDGCRVCWVAWRDLDSVTPSIRQA
jgi:hypothetical protein